MAIFSQKKTQTQIDFRKDELSNPNRRVPYRLPSGIEEKIRCLMNLMKINSGSLDIMKTSNGRYVFLEINPGGQFNMISNPCNYSLHKKIADHLIMINNDKK